MNSAQAVLIKLLSEIDEVCLENHIPYFLANQNALSAYRCEKFDSDIAHLDILMLFEDALTLVEKLTDRPGRAVESIYTNKKYPDFSFRYCDTETTRIIIDNRNLSYENQCLCIDIVILRKLYDGPLGWLTGVLERVWTLYRKYPERIQKRIERFGPFGRAFDTVFKHTQGCCRALLKPLFRHTQCKANFEDMLFVRLLSGRRKYFSRKVFATQQLVYLEGQPCFMAGQSEEYFIDVYGKNWPNKIIASIQEEPTNIIDAYSPYWQFKADVDATGETLDFAEYFATETKAQARFDKADTKVNKVWNFALRTGARFKMEELYAPRKKEILALYEQKNWTELIELFAEYDKVAVFYEERQLSVNFDNELFEIYLAVLRRQGRNELAERLKELSLDE